MVGRSIFLFLVRTMLFQDQLWLEVRQQESHPFGEGYRAKPLEPLSQRLPEPLQHGSLSQKFLAARWQHFPWDCPVLSHHTKSQLTVVLACPAKGSIWKTSALWSWPSSPPVCLCRSVSLFHESFPFSSRPGMSVPCCS